MQKPAFQQVWVGEKFLFLGLFCPILAFQVSVERLERSTNGLKGHCSTFELHARFAKNILSRAVCLHKP
jgi:hypothetical protein